MSVVIVQLRNCEKLRKIGGEDEGKRTRSVSFKRRKFLKPLI